MARPRKDSTESQEDIIETKQIAIETVAEVDEEEDDDNTSENDIPTPPMPGWKTIESALINGMPIWLSENPKEKGALGFWKKTRAFANATKRFEPYGKWVDFTTGADIPFKPLYWKERF